MNLEAFDALVRVSLIGSAAVLVVLLARRFLRRHFGAQLAYAAWLLVPASIFAMALPAPQQPVSRLLEIVRVAPAAIAAPVQATTHAMDFRLVLLFSWLAGVMLAAALFVRQQRRYLRSLGFLHARDGTYIVQSDSEFAGPALIGAWRPRIVLPVDFELRYDARERELILAHEQVHRVRGDAWANAFAVALRALNWFNPLLHYASARFRIDQELACDAVVVTRFPEARRQYADAMLKVQLAGQLRQELQLPVGCRWPSDQFLKERILMLKQSRPTRAARRFGLCLVVTMTLGFAWGAWASQSSRPLTAPAAGRSVDATLRLDVDGRQGRPIRIVHALGSEFEVAEGNWRATMTANATADGDIALDATLRRDGRVVSSPGIVAKSGEPFAIAVDDAGHDAFRVEGQLAMTNAAPPPPPAPPGVPPPPPAASSLAAPAPPAPPAAPSLA
ncbi:partial Regulatory protein BlaR1, partial [Gammaproteobacteria bacterium]